MRNEDRHLGAILAGVELLLDDIFAGVELHLGLFVELVLASDEVIAVNARRRREAGEGVERLSIGSFATEATRRANARQWNVANELTFRRVAFDGGFRILQILANS